MLIEICFSLSFVANLLLISTVVIIFKRKRSYKKAYHNAVQRCKRLIDSGKKYKELTKSLDDIFCKLRLNAKEQSSLVDQANSIICEEKDLVNSMVEINGDIHIGP